MARIAVLEEELARSRRELKDVQALASLGSYEWEVEPNRVWWSDEMFRLHGMVPRTEPIRAGHFLKVVHPDDREMLMAQVERSSRTGVRFEFDYRVILPNGAERVMYTRGEVLRREGRPDRMLGTSLDVTEHRRAERAAISAEAEMHALFAAMSDVVLVLSRDGRYLRVPTTREDLLVRPVVEMIGRRVHDTLPADTAAHIVDTIRRSLSTGERLTTEYALQLHDRECWFSATVSPLDAGSVVWVARDITETKIARKALQASEERYRLLFEQNPQPMWVFDCETLRVLAVNDAAVRCYGYSRDEFLAMTIAELRAREDRTAFLSRVRRGWQPNGQVRLWRHQRRNGELLDVEITADTIVFEGREARLVCASDVTERVRAESERARSLSLLRATLESTADGILVIDHDGRVATWNQKFVDLWQVPAEVMADERGMRVMAYIVDQVVDPEELAGDGFIRLRDGRVIECSAQPQLLDGQTVGYVWSFRDVTAREAALAERRDLIERFEVAFGKAPIGMVLVSPDGTWLQVNDAMCTLLGRRAEELVGITSASITHPDDADVTPRTIAQSLAPAGGNNIAFEKRFIHSEGRVVLASVSATAHRNERGEPDYFIAQIQDITEQREQEASVRRQALVFESINDGVIFTDAMGCILDANAATARIFGTTRERLIGRRLKTLCEIEEVRAADEVLRREGFWTGEATILRHDGTRGVAEVAVRSLPSPDGRDVTNVVVARDITSRRELERQLLQAQKLEAIGSLAAGVAHEINTPTQYVGDNVRFLGESIGELLDYVTQAHELVEAAREIPALAGPAGRLEALPVAAELPYLASELPTAAQHARDGIDRIAEIVLAMRGFSHPGSATKVFFDINTAIRNTATVCRNEWKYVAELTLDLDPTVPMVPCYPGDLQQVFLNLIVNAAHAIAESRPDGSLGSIVVSTRTDGDAVEVRVQDDGCGVPEAIRARIFDPFFTTKAVGKGTGQGLALAHNTVVLKHDGSLTFTSVEGRGTTFIVRLPLNADVELPAASPAHAA